MQISNDVSNMSQIIQQWPIDKLIEYENNPRINDHAVDKIADAIKYYGFRIPIVIKSNGSVIDGHLRLKAARKLGLKEIPVVLADDLTDIQIKAFRLSVNKMAELADWDEDLLRIELDFLKDEDFDLSLTGFDFELNYLFDADSNKQTGAKINGSLAERFIVPPFSILNAREGLWQNRKNAWIALGIKSELGRGGGDMAAAPGGSARPACDYSKRQRGDGHGRAI